MALKKRTPREGDQKKIEEAVNLIFELMSLNPRIEPTLWCAAVLSVLVRGFKESDYSYKEFREEMDEAFDYYQYLWNE